MEISTVDRAYIDAYGIAVIGASNIAGVARTVQETAIALRDSMPDSEVRKHPAILAMVGHLAFLTGQMLGPELDVLRRVEIEYTAIRGRAKKVTYPYVGPIA